MRIGEKVKGSAFDQNIFFSCMKFSNSKMKRMRPLLVEKDIMSPRVLFYRTN